MSRCGLFGGWWWCSLWVRAYDMQASLLFLGGVSIVQTRYSLCFTRPAYTIYFTSKANTVVVSLVSFHHHLSTLPAFCLPHFNDAMNKDALIKYGVQQVLAPYRPKAPGSELQKQTVIEMEASQQKKRYFWQRKPDPLDYLTPHERAVLKKVKKQARWLDKGIGCCCCQVGVDPIIGELYYRYQAFTYTPKLTNIIFSSKD